MHNIIQIHNNGCGTHNILQNIPHTQTECEEYCIVNLSPTKHCYEFK